MASQKNKETFSVDCEMFENYPKDHTLYAFNSFTRTACPKLFKDVAKKLAKVPENVKRKITVTVELSVGG